MVDFAGFSHLYDYHNQSNKTLLSFITENPQPRALNIFAHIMAADRMWHSRLELGVDAPEPKLWPTGKTPEMLAGEMETMASGWKGYLSQSDVNHSRVINYLNIKGEQTSKEEYEILTTCLFHGAYHRGQIAMLTSLRSAEGVQAPATDYIFFPPKKD
ncbi:MAG TPA: DinB family protein [Nitrospinota bacterium]|nr:DinB family protein [Nitrospinota bacterium]